MNETYKKNRSIFSKNLSFYLEKTGKTQKEMAEILGVKYTTFNDWCRGRVYPRIDKIEKMASYFGVDKSDLVEERTDRNGCEMSPAKRRLVELALNCSEDDAKDLLVLVQIFLKK